jgi:nitrogen fixation protein FixH
MQSLPAGPRKSDKYIPWYFVGFFIVLFITDGIFVYIATSTHTGVVEQSTYQHGLKYNETVAASEAQDRLGWQADMQFSTGGVLSVAVNDAEGVALKGANVRAQFFRPTQDGQDFSFDMGEVSAGQYKKPVKAAPGLWEVRIFVEWNQQQFQMTKRIVVPNP